MTKYPALDFWKKYGGLSPYDIDIEKRYTIDDGHIHFINKYGYALIDNPDHPDGTSTYHEYFLICDDLFDRILETDQNSDIVLKVISKYVSLPPINDSSIYSISKLRKRNEFFSPHHQLKRERQKKIHDYAKKYIDDFKLIVVNPPPKITDQ